MTVKHYVNDHSKTLLFPDTKLPYIFHSDLVIFQTPRIKTKKHTVISYDFSNLCCILTFRLKYNKFPGKLDINKKNPNTCECQKD